MSVEKGICTAVCRILDGMVLGAAIRGNLVADGAFKGVTKTLGPKIEVAVKPRRYDGYSSPMAEIGVTLYGAYPSTSDATLGRTMDCYDTVAARLDEYHRTIAAVKRDFTVDGFTPVGFRLGGDDDGIEIDPDTKKRYFALQFTIKGRIS